MEFFFFFISGGVYSCQVQTVIWLKYVLIDSAEILR